MSVIIEESLKLEEINAILFANEKLEISQAVLDKINQSHSFLIDFAADKVIYGINTGLGPMAQYKVDNDKSVELQYNLIRSHAAGAGKKVDDLYVKAAMLARLNTLSKAYSGIDVSTVLLLRDLINNDVFPFIPEHGSVGASGDLVQLSHLALVLIGEGKVTYKSELRPTAEVFAQLGLKPINVSLREGLCLINGTSMMTGIALVNVLKAKNIFEWTLMASAMLNEIVESFNDHFSDALNRVKLHHGQTKVAEYLRLILKDSKRIIHRHEYFDNNEVGERVFKKKVQEYYSLRCIPQILGPVLDTILYTQQVIVNELNSVSDNPIIDMQLKDVFHGGNFHGDYVSLEMDKLKIAMTRLSMLAERQANYLFNPKLNEILPPFVNLGTLGLNLGMQGVQFTATSTTAENQMLSNSMYVHSIPNNNDNQDIVSMGTNAAQFTRKVIDNCSQVLAIELIAIVQAVDYLKIRNNLSALTGGAYDKIRSLVPVFVEDTPKYEEIERVEKHIFNNSLDILEK
ncbi:MAG: aromatic amino acid lyase [Bacteroidales bacterium]|nr:aromatic amino acid lyase [Bacteroidales bacterium]